MGALDLVAKAAKEAKKAAPLFSKADIVLDELQRGKGTGNEFLTELVKKGAKPTELRERGIERALKDKPKMTKAEVQKVFEEKAPPKIKEEVRGGEQIREALDQKAREIIGDPHATYDDLYGRDAEAAKYAVERDFGYNPETQYENYKTPGGENYREILLKLPKRGLNEAQQRDLMIYESDMRRGVPLNPLHQKKYEELKARQAAGSQDYTSQHWEGTPNVLAHIRVQDFNTPEGKKVLLVDEIQSDWHQEGRKKGYKTLEDVSAEARRKELGEKIRRGVATVAEMDEADALMRNANQALSQSVPDAPFKKNWHELAMKRVLDYAAENGYDTVAITPGAEQAKRYDLSKQIDQIKYIKNPDGTYDMSVRPLGERRDTMHIGDKSLTGLSEQELEGLVGKDIAQKIVSGEGPQGGDNYRSLSGIDLQVGGEGMKGFYDKILPDYLNNFGKQYGTSVGVVDLPLGYSDESKRLINEAYARGSRADIDLANQQAQMQTMPVHSFDITPQMREEIKTKGLPLYSKTGMGPEGLAAGSGAATIGAEALTGEDEQQVQNPVHFTENPDAMYLDLMQRN